MPDSDWWGKVAADRDAALPVDPGRFTRAECELILDALEHRVAYLRAVRRSDNRLDELLARWSAIVERWREKSRSASEDFLG